MTEEEAKTKICCGPLQTPNPDIPWTKCIGSECMAWRWHYSMRDTSTNDWFRSGYKIENLQEKATGHGYCGLAGK